MQQREARLVKRGQHVQDNDGDWLKVLCVEMVTGGQPTSACIHAYAPGAPTRRMILRPNALVQVQHGGRS